MREKRFPYFLFPTRLGPRSRVVASGRERECVDQHCQLPPVLTRKTRRDQTRLDQTQPGRYPNCPYKLRRATPRHASAAFPYGPLRKVQRGGGVVVSLADCECKTSLLETGFRSARCSGERKDTYGVVYSAAGNSLGQVS